MPSFISTGLLFGSTLMSLPATAGTSGQALTTNGSGALSFGSFLPLTGGTLTGGLVGTTGRFDTNVSAGGAPASGFALTSNGNFKATGNVTFNNNATIAGLYGDAFTMSGTIDLTGAIYSGGVCTIDKYGNRTYGGATGNAGNAIGAGTGVDFVRLLVTQNRNVADKLLVVKGMAAQSGNYLECQNSGGTAMASIASDGAMAANSFTINGLSSTSTLRSRAALTSVVVSNTDASRKYGVTLSAFDTAERIGVRVDADGSAPLLAFYGGATPVAKQTITGSRGGNAALASLLTALAALNLITDSSS